MSKRRCVFCGSLFKGQKRNFEHVIPEWLVSAADLRRRKMEVHVGKKLVTVAMNRLGSASCAVCNQTSSALEGAAKTVFSKIHSNQALSQDDAVTLLDWLDKVRVGLWLWLLQINAAHHAIEPKFRISDRLGVKDRLVAIAKYAPHASMRGLAFWGVTELFQLMPSVIGLLINNLALISVSSEFLVARHLVNLHIGRKLDTSGPDEFDIHPATARERTFHFFGQPQIFAQSIFPSGIPALNSIKTTPSQRHPKLLQSAVITLDGTLMPTGQLLGPIQTTGTNVDIHTVLMEINTYSASNFLARDMLKSDFAGAENPALMRRVLARYESVLKGEELILEDLRFRYRQLTGIILP